MADEERFVNVVPYSKIKQEIIVNDEDDVVNCRLCGKGFVSQIALTNHARMEHIDSYATGDPSIWTETKIFINTEKPIPNGKMKIDEDLVKIKTEEVISSLEPTNIMDLASKDVSYIILKADGTQPKKKKPEAKSEKVQKIASRRNRETKVITGPFECLQPSTCQQLTGGDGLCHQIFFSCCEYSLHHRDEHTKRRKGIRCQVCEKPMSVDAVQFPFNCETCGEGFHDENEYITHTAIGHVKLKPFECNICHKRFTQQGGLMQHMRMHTGDRPYPCNYCPKSFTQKSGLDQHLRIHTKVKPYRCVICSKTFCQSVHLKQHMRTHTNVAPFQCGICEKRYKQSSHLNYHLKNHNPANLTEEQRAKYAELIGLISKEVVEVQIDSNEQILPYDNSNMVTDEQFVQTWAEQNCQS